MAEISIAKTKMPPDCWRHLLKRKFSSNSVDVSQPNPSKNL